MRRVFLTACWFIGSFAFAQEPEWIWAAKGAAPNEVRFFRTSFTLPSPVKQALLSLSCDNRAQVYVNGREVARSSEWQQPVMIDLREALRAGENILAVKARNDDGVAALIARVEITFADGRKQIVASNAAWLNSDKQTAGWNESRPAAITDWKPSVSLGKLGVAPWGDVFAGNGAGRVRGTPTTDLKTAPGFAAELLYAAQPGEGSWIAMTIDPRGRLIISPQNRVSSTNGGMLRVTIGADGKVAQVERLTTPLGAAMGLLAAFDSLYVDGEGPSGYGLYRLRDPDRDDQYESADFLLKLGNGEHGSHGIVRGPDNALYLMVGNHVKPPKEISPNGPLKNFAEDLLLPRQWDANGHAVGILAPGGYVLRSRDEGKTWELFCGGFRNAYDLDFNLHGELFTFDSDMEWDIGAPWYRPTRIYHCVSGGEYGWRSGTGKWPAYYPDALPPTLDIGPGSPTGVRFGSPAVKWPLKYQRALYAMDWAYGKIFAIHLAAEGATYRGEKEEFVSGKPLNVTDLEFQDGAMYFITGGRGTASALYRVTHRATESRATNSSPADAPRPLGELRRALEKSHSKADPDAIEKAWPHLDSPDRFVRAAARIAIEWQPVAAWQQRALLEKRPRAALEALLALARCGSNNLKAHLCEAITTLTLEQMDESQQLAAMRIVALTFLRMGSPTNDEQRQMLDLWSRFFPAKTEPLNRELSQLLVYLESPEVVQQLMALLARAPSQEEQMHYASVLRNARHGWTPELRRQYFAWFDKAKRDYKGGASFQKFLVNMKREAIEKLSPDERVALADLLDQAPARTAPAAPAKSAAPRGFVRLWTMADLDPLIRTGKGSAARGKTIYAEAQCASCHRFGGEGGSSGPDLTGAGARFNRRDMLEAIVQPSKVISDQYRNVMITTATGKVFTGRIVDQSPEKIALLENPLSADRTEIATSIIRGREESAVSAMPEGLLSLFSREEILDLLTFLESVPLKTP